ncbi:hypothetical protein ACFX1T_019337 [Malus domestica]
MQTPFTTIQTPFTSTTINEDFQDEDSIFPPVPSTGVGKERRQNFGNQPGKYGSPSFSDNKGENKTSKASNMYQNEAADPCNLSSSIYYDG